VEFGWTPREIDRIRLSEFWMYLEMLDEKWKRESGETDKHGAFDAIPDEG